MGRSSETRVAEGLDGSTEPSLPIEKSAGKTRPATGPSRHQVSPHHKQNGSGPIEQSTRLSFSPGWENELNTVGGIRRLVRPWSHSCPPSTHGAAVGLKQHNSWENDPELSCTIQAPNLSHAPGLCTDAEREQRK